MAREDAYIDGDARGAPRDTTDNASTISWIIIGLLAIALVAVAIFAAIAWLGDDEGSEGFNVGVTLNDVTSDPDAYYGTDVTVSGEVNEIVAPGAFTIGGEGFFGGDELLVITTGDVEVPAELERGADADVFEDDIMQVSGPVMEFVVIDVEEEAGIDLDDELLTDYDGEPVIVAEQVALNPRLSADIPAGAISIEDITDNEDAYVGQDVSLTGEISEVIGPASFFLRDDPGEDTGVVTNIGEQLLVVTSQDVVPEQLIENVPAEVTGTIRIFDSDDPERDEAAYEAEFGYEIEDGLLGGWDDEPVLFADSVSAGTGDAALAIERIATDALAYAGDEVTTGGVVQEIVDEQAFVLTSDDDDAIVDVEVLVVGQPDAFPEPIVDDAFVQVTGMVYVWDAEFEEEYGADENFSFLFEDEDTFGDWEDQVVIVAESTTAVR